MKRSLMESWRLDLKADPGVLTRLSLFPSFSPRLEFIGVVGTCCGLVICDSEPLPSPPFSSFDTATLLFDLFERGLTNFVWMVWMDFEGTLTCSSEARLNLD